MEALELFFTASLWAAAIRIAQHLLHDNQHRLFGRG
jgi:hypothetical protein